MESPLQIDELKNFLLSRKQHAAGGPIDGDKRRLDWLCDLDRLYQKVTGELLAESIAQGLVSVLRTEKEMDEAYLGTYKAPELILEISGETVRFSPKGRNIVGDKGRVDLVGELDAMTLILEPAGNWSVVLSRVPRQAAPLGWKDVDRSTSESDALRECPGSKQSAARTWMTCSHGTSCNCFC